ncbi:MAG: DUF2062 domain-containing protein [Brachymonas sp.]
MSPLPPPPSRVEPSWAQRFRQSLPKREELAQHRWLAPLADRILDRKLWTAQNESVARGVAIGTFWAFVIPFAQIIFASAHCVWWHANIPVAAAITFVTNPFTVGFWLYLAYKVGSFFVQAPPPVKLADGGGMLQWLSSIGWPAVLGMGIFAVGGSLAGYLIVKLGWRLHVWHKLLKRRHSQS